MPEVHALLSASSSKQWLNCPPSARLQENFPNESSVYAEEGTFAHSICEYKVKKYLHERVRRPQSEEFYTEELEQSTDAYYEFVVGVIEEMKRNGMMPCGDYLCEVLTQFPVHQAKQLIYKIQVPVQRSNERAGL